MQLLSHTFRACLTGLPALGRKLLLLQSCISLSLSNNVMPTMTEQRACNRYNHQVRSTAGKAVRYSWWHGRCKHCIRVLQSCYMVSIAHDMMCLMPCV